MDEKRETKPTERREGWGYIDNSKKWHYYADGGVSLCKRFMKFTQHDLQQGGNNSPDNCAECKRRLAALVSEPSQS